MYNGIYDKERFAYVHHMVERWLRLRLQGSGLGDRLGKAGVRSVAVYGIGGLGELTKKDLQGAGVRIVCWIDRKSSEYPTGVDGVPVMAPEEYGASREGDIVLVTPEHVFRPIAGHLMECGVPMERIVSLAMALE